MNEQVLKFQKNEITEHSVYLNLARSTPGKNGEVLKQIAMDELSHYNKFKKITKKDIAPDGLKVFWYTLVGRILGITFAAKLMESGEKAAGKAYGYLKPALKEINTIIKDENRHEKALLAMINEERLGYLSSMVLGLNDAIVELTGALAGFTFALQNTKVTGAAGLITGIAAALSMAAAEYLSQKSENTGRSPLKAAVYTGIAYFIVVAILITPFFLPVSCYAALGISLAGVLLVILFFSFFVSVVQEQKFAYLFREMTLVSLGVSFVAFLIGLGARHFLHIQI